MIQPARIDFGHVFARPTEAPDPDVPRGRLVKAAARRTAMLKDARDLLAVLPGPGEALHALLIARCDFLMVIVALLEKMGRCEHMRVSTLSFNSRNVSELLNQIDAGIIGRLTVLCSEFFRQNTPACFSALATGIAKRPGGHRLAAARSHAKIVCLEFADDRRMVVEGSAKLRANGNVENLMLCDDLGVFTFHSQWIDATVDKYVPDDNPSG